MNPYSNIRRIKSVVSVMEWEVEGEWNIDHMIPHFINYIVAEDDNGEKWVHENAFPDDREAAIRLAKQVEESGFINIKHWGFHEYFSLSYEERMQYECQMEEDEHEREYMEDHGRW